MESEGYYRISLSPGGKVNRPRYTLDIVCFLAAYLLLRLVVDVCNEELQWTSLGRIEAPGVNCFFNLMVLVLATGGEFSYTFGFGLTHLRAKAKDIYREFISKTGLVYMGLHHVMLNNASGVLHPVDHFLKQIYDRYFPRQCAQAFLKYKRTNPTLRLRLDHLEKYASPLVDSIPISELRAGADEIINEAACSEGFDKFRTEVLHMTTHSDFDELQIDWSSASGYPYKQGSKKADDRYHAESEALRMLHDDFLFNAYISEHVWYTTGRARLQEVADEPKGRIIIYAGYSYLLMAMLFLQPWCRFMNKTFPWCSVGFSWMHNGADKLAAFLRADRGFAPAGYRYVSLDISGWDTKLHHDVMMQLDYFYGKLGSEIGLEKRYKWRFSAIVKAMVDALVLMPLGHLFRLTQGMKSGWGATANDNTLLHEIIFRAIMKRIGYIHHTLYGDDNIMLVPDHITNDALVDEYARFGLVIKEIHSSRCISGVDFLSKKIIYRNGHYYVFRESVETHSRLLMPEEMDPRRRDRPDAVIAAERLLGHLLDNPFNSDVRSVCLNILSRLREDYGVEYIEVHDETRKKHPWRMFDTSKIPHKFPTVPTISFIEELYGVPIPENLAVLWPLAPQMPVFGERTAANAVYYETAARFSNDVAYRLNIYARSKSKNVIRKLSPYKQPTRCYGFHAARFEFAVKFFDISFKSLLDLGSHPGACAASAAKFCDDICCVSLKPASDKRDFCPYVARSSNITRIIANANDYKPKRSYDLQHDDVDIVGGSTVEEDIGIALEMIDRAINNSKHVKQCLFIVKEVDKNVIDALYTLYTVYGHIAMVKPRFSNPWKSEFMVYCKHDKKPRMRRGYFNMLMNGFLNSMASDLFVWSECLLNAIAGYEGVGSIDANPNQTDSFEKDWLTPWDRPL